MITNNTKQALLQPQNPTNPLNPILEEENKFLDSLENIEVISENVGTTGYEATCSGNLYIPLYIGIFQLEKELLFLFREDEMMISDSLSQSIREEVLDHEIEYDKYDKWVKVKDINFIKVSIYNVTVVFGIKF